MNDSPPDPSAGRGLFPPRAHFALVAVGLQLALGSALRVAFFFSFRARAGNFDASELTKAFYLGFKFDLRLALLLVLPLLVLGALPFLNPARSKPARRGWYLALAAAQALVLLTYAADFGHFEYLGERLHPAVLNEVQEVGIAASMLWSSYPVIPGALVIALCLGIYAWLLRRLGGAQFERKRRPCSRGARYAATAVLLFATVCGIYGKLSWYPLRWSDAYFSTERFVSAVALNPVLFFADSFETSGTTFEIDKARAHYAEVAELLEVEAPDSETLDFSRWQEALESPTRPRNLVVIHLESWAGFKTGCMGNTLEPSPYFDALAKQSILFTNFFVAIGPTARSVFTMLSGIPDFSPLNSASRDPRLIVQHTPIEALEGYERLYFLGGSASWANIRGMLNGSISDLEMWEEGDYPGVERPDTWGISDLHLFEAANQVLKEQERPFFAFIQTAGNHKPYSMPRDRRGFELEPQENSMLLAAGFATQRAYDGFRYLDFSLGHFMKLAALEPYFENTLFIMYGDHGLSAPNDIAYERLGLTNHHVPLLLFAPGWIDEGRRIETAASLADLLPTSLSQLGIGFLNTTFGRDLLAEHEADADFAYVQAGLVTNDWFLHVDPAGRSGLFGYRSDEPMLDRSAEFPEVTEDLRRRYDGLYECGRVMLFDNPPRAHERP